MQLIKHHPIPFAITACLLWSSAFAFVKYSLGYFGPYTLAGIRFMTAGAIVGIISLFIDKQKLRNDLSHWRIILGISFFQTIMLYGLYFIGINMARGAQSAIVIGISPLMTAIMAHFMMHNDKITIRKFVSLMIGFLGIIIISLSSKPWGQAGWTEFIGLSLLFISTASSVYGNILVAKIQNQITPVRLCGWQMTIGGIVLFVISLIRCEPYPSNITIELIFTLCWLVIISATGFTIWFLLLQDNPKVSDLNVWKFIIPVGGAIFSWILLENEQPDLVSIIGMCAVAFGVLLYNYHRIDKKNSSQQQTPGLDRGQAATQTHYPLSSEDRSID